MERVHTRYEMVDKETRLNLRAPPHLYIPINECISSNQLGYNNIKESSEKKCNYDNIESLA